MARFNNLTLTTSGVRALLEAQSGTTLTLSKIGMGSGITTNSLSLVDLISPEVMLPISEYTVNEESGFMTLTAKMTNESVAEGFYWKETGLFFQDSEGNDILFAYSCVTDNQYDYVPAYSDQRYVKHIRIANIVTDTANVVIQKSEGLEYVDVLTFEEYKSEVAENLKIIQDRAVNNNILINSNFANPVNQRGKTQYSSGEYSIDRWYCNGVGVNVSGAYIVMYGSDAVGTFDQRVDIPLEDVLGKTFTMSLKTYEKIYTHTVTLPESAPSTHWYSKKLYLDEEYTAQGAYIQLIINTSFKCLIFSIAMPSNIMANLLWAKLEYGNKATPYFPRLYAEELLLCQRYYQKVYVRHAAITGIDGSNIFAAIDFPIQMREAPTCDVTNCFPLKNYVKQTDFTASMNGQDIYGARFKFNKTSHGLTVSSILGATGYILADAEI